MAIKYFKLNEYGYSITSNLGVADFYIDTKKFMEVDLSNVPTSNSIKGGNILIDWALIKEKIPHKLKIISKNLKRLDKNNKIFIITAESLEIPLRYLKMIFYELFNVFERDTEKYFIKNIQEYLLHDACQKIFSN